MHLQTEHLLSPLSSTFLEPFTLTSMDTLNESVTLQLIPPCAFVMRSPPTLHTLSNLSPSSSKLAIHGLLMNLLGNIRRLLEVTSFFLWL